MFLTFLISFSHEWTLSKTRYTFHSFSPLPQLCTRSFDITSQRITLHAFQMKEPESKPSPRAKTAAELCRELDPPIRFRKFRIKETTFLPRIQTNPPLDKTLPLVCSASQSRKDGHKNPQEEMLDTHKRLWNAGLLPRRKRHKQIWQAEETCLNQSNIRKAEPYIIRKWYFTCTIGDTCRE